MISPLSSFLERFKSMRPPDEAARSITVEFLEKECRTTIEIAQVSVKNGTLFVDIDGPAKSEFFMRKRKLLLLLEKELGDKAPKEIR